MMRYRFQKWSAFALYVLALPCLLLIGWAAWLLAQHPDIGASWTFATGIVARIDPDGPAAGRLQPGDRILAVDGVPVQEAQFFPGKPPGAAVSLLIARDGESRLVVVYLARAAPSEVFSRLVPLFAALAFWGVGVLVLAFSPVKIQGLLFFLFGQVSSATLAAGSVSSIGPLWTVQLFGVLFWWLGAFAVHFHLHFPISTLPRYSRRLLTILYFLAMLGSVPGFILDPVTLYTSFVFPLYAARRLWLAVALFGVLFLLVRAYRRAASPEVRRQVGVVALSGGMAVAPLVTLSLVPDALLSQPLLPYEMAFLFLPLIPLSYGYAILRYRLIRLERYVSRGAASVLVLTLLGGLYLALNIALARVWQAPIANLVITLLLAAAFGPLRRRLQIIVNRLFYGEWYDYRTAVRQVSQTLDRAADSSALAQALSRALQIAMQLECACLLLSDRKGNLLMSGVACQECIVNDPNRLRVDATGPLGRYLQTRMDPLETHALREASKRARLSDEEAQLLACERALLWLPLPGRERALGVLILGSKRGKGTFDADDLAILEVVIRQASITLQNIQLIAELEQRAWENARLYRQTVRAREEERKRLARELHDQIIQALVMLNYHLSERQSDSAIKGQPARLQDQVRHILGDVRRICADLRPPVLDSMGLVSAVQSLVRELKAVTLTVEGDPEQDLPDEVALCLYRVLQEALSNAQKHAAAQRVNVRLRISPDEVFLSVEDDGRGFTIPERLGLLTGEGHFGLVGLRERVELVNGTLNITSAPGQGCQLEARVPLAEKQDEVADLATSAR